LSLSKNNMTVYMKNSKLSTNFKINK
jgi:hypothetical protein